MTNLDSIFKSRDITLPPKVRLVKAMVLSSSTITAMKWIGQGELRVINFNSMSDSMNVNSGSLGYEL